MKFYIIIFSVLFILGIGVYGLFFRSSEKITPFTRADATLIEWDALRNLDVTSSTLPQDIQALNGTQIKIAGFIIPLEDNQDVVREFLFVPSPMTCIHVPPPPPNQIIHVTMASGKIAKMSYGPVWLFGKLILIQNPGKHVKNSFEMIGLSTQPYQN